eukprot:scaffold93431_cov33-Tisochrysis_lutea.AAC.1
MVPQHWQAQSAKRPRHASRWVQLWLVCVVGFIRQAKWGTFRKGRRQEGHLRWYDQMLGDSTFHDQESLAQ